MGEVEKMVCGSPFLIKDDVNTCRKVSNTIKNYDSTFGKKLIYYV